MEIAPWELAERYRKLSDDELVCLWADRADLTAEASEQLQLEMGSRRISDSQAAEISQEQVEFTRLAELPTYIRSGVSRLGIGYLGKRDRVAVEEGVEEFTSTRFFCFAYFPLVPLGSHRVRRRLGGFWSRLFSLGDTYAVKEITTDWLQVLMFWALGLGIVTAFVVATRISVGVRYW